MKSKSSLCHTRWTASTTSSGYQSTAKRFCSVTCEHTWGKSFINWQGSGRVKSCKGICARIMCTCTSLSHQSIQWRKWLVSRKEKVRSTLPGKYKTGRGAQATLHGRQAAPARYHETRRQPHSHAADTWGSGGIAFGEDGANASGRRWQGAMARKYCRSTRPEQGERGSGQQDGARGVVYDSPRHGVSNGRMRFRLSRRLQPRHYWNVSLASGAPSDSASLQTLPKKDDKRSAMRQNGRTCSRKP